MPRTALHNERSRDRRRHDTAAIGGRRAHTSPSHTWQAVEGRERERESGRKTDERDEARDVRKSELGWSACVRVRGYAQCSPHESRKATTGRVHRARHAGRSVGRAAAALPSATAPDILDRFEPGCRACDACVAPNPTMRRRRSRTNGRGRASST